MPPMGRAPAMVSSAVTRLWVRPAARTVWPSFDR